MAGSVYAPAPGALPVGEWSNAIRSQRDLTFRVPINYATLPGVSLTKACFGHGVYNDHAATICLSNLLATGFRRITFDVYWDVPRRAWSFCPVQVPPSGSDTNASSRSSSSSTASSTTTSATQAFQARNEHVKLQINALENRQTTELALTATASSSSSGGTSGGTSVLAQTVASSTPSAVSGVNAGPYSCSPAIDLPVLLPVLVGFFSSTSDTVRALLTELSLNLHVASLPDDPSAAPSELNATSVPSGRESISAQLKVNLTDALYTPSLLNADRGNLNSSWLKSDVRIRPLPTYFNISANNRGVATTQNGWPTEGLLDFDQQLRLIVGFGRIDPQLKLYDIAADAETVFASNVLQNQVSDTDLGSDSSLPGNCLYDPDSKLLASNNNSFASFESSQLLLSSRSELFNQSVPQLSNLTDCGISPILNETLFNTTADQDFTPYQQFARSSFWAWGYGEPRVVNSSEADASKIRCAAMDLSLNGRWRVIECSEKHLAACRIGDGPFTWKVTSTRATYSYSDQVCPEGSTFAVPVTPLESRHLFKTLQQSTTDELVWLNFNNLATQGCWVSGVNATCFYNGGDSSIDKARTVIVPTVAAVIIFVVAALTIFVKCAANRRSQRRKRRRKGEDGWDYEGVPS